MMLKRVDLPQPEGPMTARNSPGLTLIETRSMASSGPSGVSNCLVTSLTTKMPVSAGIDEACGVVSDGADAIAMHALQRPSLSTEGSWQTAAPALPSRKRGRGLSRLALCHRSGIAG